MQLWNQWWSWVEPLRAACSRTRSFLWLAAALAGMSIRGDLLGVTGIIRALGFCERFYDRLLDFFHSSAVDPDALSRCWTRLVFHRLPGIVRANGRPVLLGDGIKIPKRGRKMPAVKLLHQVSESNTKPEYIMGHSIQAVSLLVSAASSFFAVPLSARIHEGLVFSNRDHRTLPGKFLSLVESLGVPESFYLVADAYYACRTMALGLVASGSHLISRLRKNAVAYELAPKPDGKRKRGRPRLYGPKIRLFSLFEDSQGGWITADSPVYGEKGVSIRYRSMDLVWRPIRRLARYVFVDHPHRGRVIFLCTDLDLCPLEIIRLYGLRFKIELSFKQAVRTVGVYAYHFWMVTMDSIKSRSGNQYLHHKSAAYRDAVRRKLDAYHRHIQVGLVAQGILQCLAVTAPALVWSHFGSWLCTIRPGTPPSEFVVMAALRHSLPEFLVRSAPANTFTRFLRDRLDLDRAEGLRLVS
jgi:DDE superfamily endonuclease